MNYSEIFHFMRPELTLIVTIALLFLFDLFAPERLRRSEEHTSELQSHA